jgi:hypothetical protein
MFEPGRQRPAGRALTGKLIQTMKKDNQPTFAERIRALKAAAETVMLEAQRMEAAARKFSERKQQKTSRATNWTGD